MKELVKIDNNKILINEDFVKRYREFKKIQLEMELEEKEFKLKLKNAMELLNIDNLLLEGFSATYKKGGKRVSVDSKKLKQELPDIYEEYSKTTEYSPSVMIKVE